MTTLLNSIDGSVMLRSARRARLEARAAVIGRNLPPLSIFFTRSKAGIYFGMGPAFSGVAKFLGAIC